MVQQKITELDYSKFDFKNTTNYFLTFDKGLSEKVVAEISKIKNEPDWMLKFRLNALKNFYEKTLPMWGADLTKINFDDITYFAKAMDKKSNTWEELPDEIKKTYDKLGIPEAERKFLSGVEVMYESQVVYSSIKKDLEAKGIIFCDTDTALKKYPEIFKKHFGTVIPPDDNKLAALNSAVWSGGSFVYVPAGVKVELPLQAYFRINAANMGQFERTLIIAEEGSDVTYIEGCSAPVYSKDSLHSAVVEIIAKKNAH
ncbi:MAG TPA: Fe-S cluster assembly protein SufB, partial [archaeon]|nr:Fe-S cluster assembly protein SufB [archaeon]